MDDITKISKTFLELQCNKEEEWFRLSSFHCCPRSGSLKSNWFIKLAKVGLIYESNANKINCINCSFTYDVPKEGIGDVLNDHTLFSKDCWKYLSSNARNIQIKINLNSLEGNPVTPNNFQKKTPTKYPELSLLLKSKIFSLIEQYKNNNTEHNQKSILLNPKTLKLESVINGYKPKYPEFSWLSKRIETFDNIHVPSEYPLHPLQVAKSGFFYTGQDDTVRCFFCGNGLKHLKTDDDIWIEHAKYFPICMFLVQNKGNSFIEKAKNMTNAHILMQEDQTLQHDNSDNKLNENVMNCLGAQCAKIIGFPDAWIEETILNWCRLTGIKASEVPGEGIVKILLDFEEGIEKNCLMHENNNDNKNIIQNTQLQELIKEHAKLTLTSLCCICFEEKREVALLPCGHAVSCHQCAFILSKCPTCFKNVEALIRVFCG